MYSIVQQYCKVTCNLRGFPRTKLCPRKLSNFMYSFLYKNYVSILYLTSALVIIVHYIYNTYTRI